jgi:superfamily I DNA and/or RNA helicase
MLPASELCGGHASACDTQVLGGAEVVCATCVGSGGEQLAGICFPLVVLDEGSQCSEPEALIPLTKVSQSIERTRQVRLSNMLPP